MAKTEHQLAEEPLENFPVGIYTISRAHGKTLAKWVKVIEDVEEKAEYRGPSYAPLRFAIISLVQGNKDAEDILNEGFSKALATAKFGWQQKIVKSMWQKATVAFERFKDELAERFGKFHEHYEMPGNTNFVNFEDVQIKGRFHFYADFDGKPTLVYVACGVWDHLETEALVEMLTIVAEEAHKHVRENVLFLDLSQAQPLIKARKSFKRLRKELLDLARNLQRIMRAIAQE